MAAGQQGGVVVQRTTWQAGPVKLEVMCLPIPRNKPAKGYFLGQSSPDTGEALDVGHCLSKQLFVCLQEAWAL